MINQTELAMNDKARNSAQLQTLVYGCIIAHPRHERNEGCTIAGRQILAGGQKSLRMLQVLSIRYICFLKTLGSNMGVLNLLLAPGAI